MKPSTPITTIDAHNLHHLSLPNKPPHAPLFYEPTSVLDPHLTSSPAAAASSGGAATPTANSSLPPLPSFHPDADDPDWVDPSSFLDLPPDYPLFDLDVDYPPPPSPPPPFDRSHLDLLLRAAASLESGDLHSTHVILSRLNHLSTTGGPLQRAAFLFKDALLSLLPIPNPPLPSPPLSPLELIHRISAHKSLSDLSPLPQFVTLTANQTLLESLLSNPADSIHLLDFDLGLGGQWSSFFHEVVFRSRSSRRAPPAIRITAIVPDESLETALAADNLRDFARALGLKLSVDLVRVAALGTLALAGVRLSSGEPAAAVLSPSVFRLLGPSSEAVSALLRFVRRAQPKVVVFVDAECGGPTGSDSFRRGFAAGLEFYAAVLESLDSAAAGGGAEAEEAVRRIERCVVRPRVFAAVGAMGWAPARGWREVLAGAGMVPAEFSEFTESQAEWLVRRAPVEGFQVARKEGAMVLSWRGRELAATSAWRC